MSKSKMTKCDFCEQSNSKGKCRWLIHGSQYYDKDECCKKAIKRMVKALRE